MSKVELRKSRPLVPLVFALVAAATIAVVFAALRPADSQEADERGAGALPGQGVVRLTVPLPPDATLASVSYVVKSAHDAVLAQGTVPVAGSAMLSHVVTMPVGDHNIVTFVGNAIVDGVARSIPLGGKVFDVKAGPTTVVTPDPPAGHAASRDTDLGGGAPPTTPVATSSADNLVACGRCQHDSKAGVCDPPNLTATSTTDAASGQQTAIGWGCSTLATDTARTACLALWRCINAKDCHTKGQNPVMGCYCGAAAADVCIGGQGLTGPCIAEYRAAALASPDAPRANAGVGELSTFIATNASDPITPVGLADNLSNCAAETQCDICTAI